MNYAALSGTATVGVDFGSVSGAVTFAPGETQKTVYVPLMADSDAEGTETFQVVLSGASTSGSAPAPLIPDGTGGGTIIDNTTPTISVAPVTVTEGDTDSQFNAIISATAPTASAYNIVARTVSGDADIPWVWQYIQSRQTVQMNSGSTEVSASFGIIGDIWPEPTRTFSIAADSYYGSAVGQVTIIDDDGPYTYQNVVNILKQRHVTGGGDLVGQLSAAHAESLQLRAKFGSQDLVYRDAEYYVYGMELGATATLSSFIAAGLGTPAYVFAKHIANFFGGLGQLSVDPNHAASQPGGIGPAYLGYLEGLKLRLSGDVDTPVKVLERGPTPALPGQTSHSAAAPASSAETAGDDYFSGIDVINSVAPGEPGPSIVIDRLYGQWLNLGGTEQLVVGGDGDNLIAASANPVTIFASGGNDVVRGGASVDMLDGGSGHDRLDGGASADVLVGGSGNDTYVVDSAGDRVFETTTPTSMTDASGTDSVESSVSFTLGTFVENLVLLGTGAISGTGNTLSNIITGNAAANSLSGASGNDTLSGGSGKDKLMGGAGKDLVTGGTETDTFVFTKGTSGIATTTADTIIDWNVADVIDMTIKGTSTNYKEGATTATSIATAAAFAEKTFTSTSTTHVFLYNRKTDTGYVLSDLDNNDKYETGVILRGAGAAANFSHLDIL